MVTLMRFNIFMVFVVIFAYVFVRGGISLLNDDFKEFNFCVDVGFFMSLILIVSLTLFPVTTDFYVDPRFNLIPFKTITSFFNHGSYVEFLANVVGNVVMFVPFGLFCCLKFGNRFGWSMLLVLCLTVFVEFGQLFLAMRFTDIDDIILNFLGGLIGIIVAKVIVFVTSLDRAF